MQATPTPTASSSSDVVSARIDTLHIRTDYELADVFEAIAQVARPGSQVAAFIDQQYLSTSDRSPNMTRGGRKDLQAIGASFDSLSLFLPHVWILKSIGTGAAIVAKSLRNETVSASDMLDMNGAYKGVSDLAIQHTLLVRAAPDRATFSQTKPASIKALQAIPPFAPALRGLPGLFPRRTETSPAVRIAAAELAPLHELPRQAVVLNQALTRALPEAPPRAPPKAPPETLAKALPETLPKATGPLLLHKLPGRGSGAPTPVRYAMVGELPFVRQTTHAGRLEWQAPPLSWYRADVVRPDGSRPLFSVGEQDYVSIDGAVYAVRDMSATSLKVFNPTDLALPPLPVEARQGIWHFGTIKDDDILDTLVLASGKTAAPDEDADGLIRTNNKKYLRLGDKVIAADRSAIVGEPRIASSAQRIMERLPAPDIAGFIRWRDGQVMIEGRFGYYSTRYDARLGMVVDDVAGVPVPVHYDAFNAQWQVGAAPASAAWRQALYSRHSDLSQQAYPEIWQSASVPSGSTSASAESLQDWAAAQDFPFMHHWPRLALALKKSFDRLASMSLSRPNRRSPIPLSQAFDMVHSIDGIRRCAYRLMPDIDVWESLSVTVRQAKAAAYTWDVYKGFHAIGLTMEMNLGVQALCSEMTELMLVQASRHLRSGIMPFARKERAGDTSFLEIQIKEQLPLGRTGRAHVALMGFKSKTIMEAGFGAVSTSPSASHSGHQPVLKEMSNTEFRDFAYQNRREILLIDPWGPRKIIDFGMAGGVDAAISELLFNLKEARFGDFTNGVGYSVQAFVPPRGGTARGTWMNSLEEEG